MKSYRFDPVDLEQMRLLGRLSPGRRIQDLELPLLSFTIGVVTADDGPFADAREIIRAASEAR